jgi:hypothetical protein
VAADESEEARAVPARRSYRPRVGAGLSLSPERDSDDDGLGITTAAEAAAAEPDPIALIRTFLVQRLVDEHVLAQDERTEVRTTDDPGKPADPSSTGLVVPPARRFRAEVAAGRAGAPEVHLHIDRIEVIRPTASRPAPPRRNAPPVDHEAYLARRRAERR